jgi:hypothetical protein
MTLFEITVSCCLQTGLFHWLLEMMAVLYAVQHSQSHSGIKFMCIGIGNGSKQETVLCITNLVKNELLRT